MLKLKPQYFGHLMRRGDSFEKTLMLGKIEGRRRRGRPRMRRLDGIVFLIHVLSPKEMATCQPNSQEIFLQVLNLADDEITVTVQGDKNNTLLAESIKSFQVTYGHE